MIAAALETAGFDTPATYVFKHQGDTYASERKAPPANQWNAYSIGKILHSPVTMGYNSSKARKLARDEKDLPTRIVQPLFTDEEWAAIQAAMDELSVTREHAKGAAPWLGEVYCGRCGDPLCRQENHARNGRVYEYYRCVRRTGKPACKGQSVKAGRSQPRSPHWSTASPDCSLQSGSSSRARTTPSN
ncbi:recombinase family protein [Streptomyces sp. NRRL S-495]|uniref:recombinase family protein n=1 Tax=Streptomyces sp. NRRL S-495 TaxID=1609133 RepID=UPI0005F8C9D0|nr:recombinase family protein [Streptomyces sp. NRRL S-495]KJY35964.1 hypothetical protein VR45_12775 [Streptomyces sp. NRRL S-495]